MNHLESASLARFLVNLESALLARFLGKQKKTIKNDFFVSIRRQNKEMMPSWEKRFAPKSGDRAPNLTEGHID